ncbi:MAG: hypothetical protein ACMVY4_17445 [Minwuia sp.]|uniref:hypothetical protein n=1 Tax=Minwuia sp. TaxID=2493630 RepID=UPI003A88435E
MNRNQICRHAAARMNQRGLRKQDIDIVEIYGEFVDDDAIMLTYRHAAAAIKDAKTEIRRLQRWDQTPSVRAATARLKKRINLLQKNTNTKIVLRDGVLVTAYRTSGKPMKRSTRRMREGFV